MRYKGIIIIVFVINFFIPYSYAQTFSRIEADFSIKEKFVDGSQKLTIGKVYYDKNYRKIIYDISFPEKQILLLEDTTITEIKNNIVISSVRASNVVNFSIFNLCLNGKLSYFGLKNTRFKLTNIDSDENMVITTWESSKTENQQYMKVLLSQVDKKLYGLISYDENDNMISKQIFENYNNIDGLDFPEKVIQFFYFNNTEQIKMVEYSNVIINNMRSEEFYNYTIPGN